MAAVPVSSAAVNGLALRRAALASALIVVPLLQAPVPAAAQSRIEETSQRCAIGSGGAFRAVIPCGITAINHTLTITWQVSGRGVGTNVAAADQWLGSAGVWKRCRALPICLEATNGGFQIRQTRCAPTLTLQPIELDRRMPLLPAHC